jgi:hypothetical protein
MGLTSNPEANENKAQMRTRSLAACSARKKNESGPLASEQAKWLIFLFSGLLLAFSGCTFSNRVDNRNFAIDSYSPTPNEIQLAQQRAERYWQKNSQRFKSPTRYLAVATASVLQGDVVQNLYPKIINAETTAGYFSQSENYVLDATCVMIYDTAANRFVSNSGYISLELPPLASVARWNSYMARYIGW